MCMQIFIINKRELDEITNFSEQRLIHQKLFNDVIQKLGKKEKIDSCSIKRDSASDYLFVFSHAFQDILFFDYRGVI